MKLAVGIALVFASIYATGSFAVAASTDACVTGSDPIVVGDLAQVAALRTEIGMRCPCFDYDATSREKGHGAYVRCARGEIRTASKSGNLRPKCSRLVKVGYKQTTCGYGAAADPRAPCIETRVSSGAVRCRVKPLSRCDGSSRILRTACAAIESCVVAADDNGNFIFDNDPTGGDDGACSTAAPIVRFVVVGDTGRGDTNQFAVADGIAAKCAVDGCDFVQLLGDNIYPSGVSSVLDAQWQSKFEVPYQNIGLPFYAVLGNHDYGGNGAGNEFSKGQHEIDYSSVSSKWKMPAAHYRRSWHHVDMFGLDTNLQMFGLDAAQRVDVGDWLDASTAQWRLAFGHHPYLSNGPHGNAGNYDGAAGNGATVESFFDDIVCGNVDVYFSGHDHSMQWLTSTCSGTELIVSGAGSQTTSLPGANPVRFQDLGPGFAYVTVDGNTLTAELVAANGTTLFTRSLIKP